MAVPLSRGAPVLPGEEVDVAVSMSAPAEVGRYLGYWRLVGPMGRRKFGQRVWVHVQVVDPADADRNSALPTEAELASVAAEIEKKKNDATAGEAGDHDHDNDGDEK